ncbi:MAG: helix-turn-helix domain-containing protein [Chloroflexi bacterium]|nr:helix-turn-helix domain-containing protein [Chloroflexota bacterium]
MKKLPEIAPTKILSTEEVAQIAGVTPRTVRRWCVSGVLKSEQLGREYAILWQDFVSFWQERNK